MGNPILDSDWFDGCMGWVIVGLIGICVLAIVGLVVGVGIALTHPSTPSLFCPNGAVVHESPTTQVVGKIPEDGTLYTCDGGQ